MGYRIPGMTLPPSLVLVKRLFLSVKSISCNITYLLTIYTLVTNITSHIIINLRPSCVVSGRRYGAHATSFTCTRLPCLGPQEPKENIVGSVSLFNVLGNKDL